MRVGGGLVGIYMQHSHGRQLTERGKADTRALCCSALRPPSPGPLLERAIGVIYRPRTERQSHYFFAQLPSQFDSVIHLDVTSGVLAGLGCQRLIMAPAAAAAVEPLPAVPLRSTTRLPAHNVTACTAALLCCVLQRCGRWSSRGHGRLRRRRASTCRRATPLGEGGLPAWAALSASC